MFWQPGFKGAGPSELFLDLINSSWPSGNFLKNCLYFLAYLVMYGGMSPIVMTRYSSSSFSSRAGKSGEPIASS